MTLNIIFKIVLIYYLITKLSSLCGRLTHTEWMIMITLADVKQLVESKLAGENEGLGTNAPQRHKSNIARPEIEARPPRCEAVS
jgi:hypothetical protein